LFFCFFFFFLGLILRVRGGGGGGGGGKEPYNGADLDRYVRTVKNAALNQSDFETPDRTPPPYCKTTSSLQGFICTLI